MKGTGKQIAWAESLIENLKKEVENGLKETADDTRKEAVKVTIEKMVDIMNEAYAGDVIDLLKDNHETGAKYFARLMATIRTLYSPMTEKIKVEVFGKK